MNHKAILTILLLITINCSSQVETLMRNINGKDIKFKNKYENVVAQYETDSTIISTNTDQTIDLEKFGCGYYKQNFVKTKVDLYVNKKDTVIYTYGFFKNRLFEINIYSNNDSINKLLAKNLQDYFSIPFRGMIQGMQVGHFHKQKTVKKVHVYSNFKYNQVDNRKSMYIILTYDPIRKYLPLWCPMGRKSNWEIKMEKKLTSN